MIQSYAQIQWKHQLSRKSENSKSLFDFEGVFGDDYLHFYNPDFAPERNEKEADVIRELLLLQKGELSWTLDVVTAGLL